MEPDHIPAPDPDLLKFDQWCLLEIMGHQKFAGRVTEQTIGGTSFLRIHIPGTLGKVPFTKFFSASSVYSITPTTEALARAMAQKLDQEPISIYDLPEAMREKLRQLTAPRLSDGATTRSYDGDPFDDDDEDPDIDTPY